MRRSVIVLVLLALVQAVSFAGARTSNLTFDSLEDFSGIVVDAPYDVYITQAGHTGVRVGCDGKLEQYVDISVRGGILYIGIKNANIKNIERYVNRNGYKLSAYVSVDDLERLDASGVSKVYADEGLEVDELDVSISGVSEFEGKISGKVLSLKLDGVSRFSCRAEFSSIDARIAGASRCGLEGLSDGIAADISGASVLDAYSLECRDAKIYVSGASKAEVRPSKTISFDVSGVSSIKYPDGVDIESMSVTGMSVVKTF